MRVVFGVGAIVEVSDKAEGFFRAPVVRQPYGVVLAPLTISLIPVHEPGLDFDLVRWKNLDAGSRKIKGRESGQEGTVVVPVLTKQVTFQANVGVEIPGLYVDAIPFV